MAKQTGRGLDETRAALLTQIAWGTAAANVDIATIKEHKVFELTLLSEGLSATDLDPARRILRGLQELAAPASGRVPQDAHAIAKDCAAARARATTVHGGEIHADGWNYAKDVEIVRRDRTLRIIERARPGPHEDGRHLESLAREAAALEMTIAGFASPTPLDRVLDRIVLGTTDEPRNHAGATRRGDGVAIIISTGLLDFLGQVARSVVLALKPTPPPDAVLWSFSAKREDTAAVLARDSTPGAILHDTLVSWLCRGSAAPAATDTPPAYYASYIEHLERFAQRFVIAHEYGHALHLLGMHIPGLSDTATPDPKLTEHNMDALGVTHVFNSAEVDRAKPNIALQGAVLAMKSQEILDRALLIACSGRNGILAPSHTHPPFEQRLETIYRMYDRLTQTMADPKLAPEAMKVPADTLELVWERVAPGLPAALKSRHLHPIWARRVTSAPIRKDRDMTSASDGEKREVMVVVDPADFEEVKRLAADNGVDVEEIQQEDFTGVEILLVIFGVGSAVALTIDAIERLKGGQVIDMRPGAVRMAYRTRDLMYGLVIIIGVDGSLTLEVKEPTTMFATVVEAVQKVVVELAKDSRERHRGRRSQGRGRCRQGAAAAGQQYAVVGSCPKLACRPIPLG